ncbi:hypothetical protein [Streptomyces sp. NPDC059468]|uniref:hypothetical protein n=1 Tax=Streptomyces sp. NPDC059468 TaxID=3346845 RepID=UPI0036738358
MSPQKQAVTSQTALGRLRNALRHPRTYARECGFGTFHILFLPTVTVGSLLLTALYLDHLR